MYKNRFLVRSISFSTSPNLSLAQLFSFSLVESNMCKNIYFPAGEYHTNTYEKNRFFLHPQSIFLQFNTPLSNVNVIFEWYICVWKSLGMGHFERAFCKKSQWILVSTLGLYAVVIVKEAAATATSSIWQTFKVPVRKSLYLYAGQVKTIRDH